MHNSITAANKHTSASIQLIILLIKVPKVQYQQPVWSITSCWWVYRQKSQHVFKSCLKEVDGHINVPSGYFSSRVWTDISVKYTLAKEHLWGSITRNARMAHTVNSIGPLNEFYLKPLFVFYLSIPHTSDTWSNRHMAIGTNTTCFLNLG